MEKMEKREREDKVYLSDDEVISILINNFGRRQFIDEAVKGFSIFKGFLKSLASINFPLPNNLMEIEDVINTRDYEQIYDFIQHERMITNSAKWYYDCVLVVICYFKLDKDSEAKDIIESLSYITSGLPQVILNIGQKLGAEYIPANNDSSSFHRHHRHHRHRR